MEAFCFQEFELRKNFLVFLMYQISIEQKNF